MAVGRLWLAVLAVVLIPLAARAEGPSLHGFVQANMATLVSPGRDGEHGLGEYRAQFELSHSSSEPAAGAFAKVDVVADAPRGVTWIETREAYIWGRLGQADLRLGRQILTWGVGDLLFVNDLFPKDYVSFFLGRPLQYLKLGSDALVVRYYGPMTVEGVVTPFFRADETPGGDPFRIVGAPPTPLPHALPARTVGNGELALRVERYTAGFDLAAYAYRGFYGQPTPRPGPDGALGLEHPPLSAYGASFQRGDLGGLVRAEAAYYDSRHDRAGDDPAIPNSRAIWLVGYEREWRPDLTGGFQVQGERMRHHGAYEASLPPETPRQERWRHLVTARLTQRLRYQTLTLGAFAFYSPSDKDTFIIPEVRYAFADALWAALGANVFGGTAETGQFAPLRHNDNLYLTVRYGY